MKTALITLSILTMSMNAKAAESTKWVEGPFWKASQVTSMSRIISPLESELQKRCDIYKNFYEANKNEAAVSTLVNKIDRLRKTALLNFQGQFSATFLVENNTDKPVFEEVVEGAGFEDDSRGSLPFYIQPKATTYAFVKDVKKLSAQAREDSFIGLSERLGLEASSATFNYNRAGELIVTIDGADLACDILLKKAVLKTSIQSFVKLPNEEVRKIEALYNSKIAPELDAVLPIREGSSLKAARLGFRIGKVLEDKSTSNDSDVVEKQISKMMKALFNDDYLTTSSNVSLEKGKRYIQAANPIKGEAVTLTLGAM